MSGVDSEGMKIYLDDIRSAPDGWERYTRAEDVCAVLLECAGKVEAVSLDNDLGSGRLEGVYVAKLICALAISGWIGSIELSAHTDNPAAELRMENYFTMARGVWERK